MTTEHMSQSVASLNVTSSTPTMGKEDETLMCTDEDIDLYVSWREGLCDEALLSTIHCDLARASNSSEEVGLMTTKEVSSQEI